MKKSNQINLKPHIIYRVKTLAKRIRISEKTITRWIDEGLVIVAGSEKKVRIIGYEVTRFIRERQKSKKVTLKNNEFYCMTCKGARCAKRGTIKISDNAKVAKCRSCNGNIRKIFKQLNKGL